MIDPPVKEYLQRQFQPPAPPDARQDPPPKEYLLEGKAWNEPDELGDYHVGDMRLDEHQFKSMYGTEEETTIESRQAILGEKYRWTDGVLPYTFDSGVTEANKEKVRQAVASFNTHLSGCLNIRFVYLC